MKIKYARMLALSLLMIGTQVLAQTSPGKEQWEEYSQHIRSRSTIAALGPDLFGDNVDLDSGALSFSTTDVSLQGNDALPVAFTRSFKVSNRGFDFQNDLPLADWDLDLPRISGVFAANWQDQRCTGSGQPPTVTQGGKAFNAYEYWHGTHASLPGGGELLAVNTATPMPASGGPYRWVTGGRAYFSCLPSIQNGSGEGFLAITPNGTKYWFNRMAQNYQAPLEETTVNGVPMQVDRRKNSLYVTRIEDRFGNWVSYSYSNASNQPARLNSIDSSDGRSLSIQYNGYGHVWKVHEGTRTWTYEYAYPSQLQATLTRVILPDTSEWSMSLGALSSASIHYNKSKDPDDFNRSCFIPGDIINKLEQPQGTITHPSGAVGTFTVKIRRQGRTNVPAVCANFTLPYNNPNDDIAFYPINWDEFALAQKQVSGPGLTPATWTYDYTSSATYFFHSSGGGYPVCGSPAGCEPPSCVSDACAGSKTTTITGPNQHWMRYSFGNSYRYNEGKLLTIEQGASDTSILKTTTYAYNYATSGQPYISPLGDSPDQRGNSFTAEFPRPQVSRTIVQDGVTFASQVNTSCTSAGIYCFDIFARVTSVTRSSSLGYTKTETTEYHDNLSSWVIGQVKRTTTDGIETSRTTYDATTALPIATYSFGKLQSTMGYYTNGVLQYVQDGRGAISTITLSNWRRGIPQLIQHPDSTSQSAVVSNSGWLTSVTDENGSTHCYGYDVMGRISSITYPTEDTTSAGNGVCDTSAWNATTQVFQKISTAEYGIPGGHWRQTVTTGNAEQITYYDGLWRPLVVRERDLANPTQTTRFNGAAYDASGRKVFDAYPLESITTTASFVKGVRTTYDALDRRLTRDQDSELGVLSTVTEYLPGFQTRVTNPRGYLAGISGYQVYDAPSYDLLAWRVQAHDKVTEIYRDGFGKPVHMLQRSGDNAVQASRRYVYDGYQQLCKTIEPETASTVLWYDAAGNLEWSAGGLNLPSTSSCNIAEGLNSGRKVERYYNARNRLTTLLFADGRGNQSWEYFPDGKPKRVLTYNGAGGTEVVENTYTYHRRGQMTAETSAQSWYTWPIGYGYNRNGHLASQVSPTYLTLTYLPNALGQPTAVTNQWGGSYASGVSYYPNGAIKQFTYGNGITHTMQQNDRQLPMRSTDNWGAMDYGYDYDENGNPTLITDYARGGNYSRWLSYDGLDRLTDAGSCSFGGDCWHRFTYDALDNLKSWKLAGVKDYANYYYDPNNNQLINIQNTAGASVVGFGYDAQGNLNNKNGQGYDFDYGNRLRTVYNQEFYRYDAHGRRVHAWRQPGHTIVSMYSATGQLAYQSDGSKAKSFDHVYLGGSLIASIEYRHSDWVSTTKYQHTDALGSPVAVTDSAGFVIDRTAWEPYGAAIGKPAYDGIGYTGHVMDGATGLTYMQQRYYDPQIGRFLSVDPVTASSRTGANFNRYWYAANNPYRFTDPDGRICTGSHIKNSDGNCASTGEATTRDSTAVMPQTVSSSMVKSVGPTQAPQGQVDTVVKDANAVGRTAKAAGDSRAIRAFNKIEGINIDSSDWNVGTYLGGSLPKTTVVFALYAGGEKGSIVLGAQRYFIRDDYGRASRFMHEVFHLDSAFYAASILGRQQCGSNCSGWDFRFERDVEIASQEVMNKGWLKANEQE